LADGQGATFTLSLKGITGTDAAGPREFRADVAHVPAQFTCLKA
jgi:hypothetical protein